MNRLCLMKTPRPSWSLWDKGGNEIWLSTNKTSQYGSYTEAQTYAQTSPLAYVGQVLSVVENGESKQYQIKDTAGTLEPLGGLGDIGVATDEEVEEMLTEVFSDDDNT